MAISDSFGLLPENQAVVIKAFRRKILPTAGMCPKVESFVKLYALPFRAPAGVRDLLLQNEADRSSAEFFKQVAALTGFADDQLRVAIPVWYRYCLDEGQCEILPDGAMLLTERAIEEYTQSLRLPTRAAELRETDAESLLLKLPFPELERRFFVIPNFIFRLIEFNVHEPFLDIVELVHASEMGYTWDEVRIILKLWREFCIDPRNSGYFFYCYMDSFANWHLDDAAIREIKDQMLLQETLKLPVINSREVIFGFDHYLYNAVATTTQFGHLSLDEKINVCDLLLKMEKHKLTDRNRPFAKFLVSPLTLPVEADEFLQESFAFVVDPELVQEFHKRALLIPLEFVPYVIETWARICMHDDECSRTPEHMRFTPRGGRLCIEYARERLALEKAAETFASPTKRMKRVEDDTLHATVSDASSASTHIPVHADPIQQVGESAAVHAVELPSPVVVGNRASFLYVFLVAYEVSKRDLRAVGYVVGSLFQNREWVPAPELLIITESIKRPGLASREFLDFLTAHPKMPVGELATVITARDSPKTSYRERKRTCFCIMVWREFGTDILAVGGDNWKLNDDEFKAYLTKLRTDSFLPANAFLK